MEKTEFGPFLKLYNRDGYVLDFLTSEFDAFTSDSIGVALCEHYHLSKAKSLNAYVHEASLDDASKLLMDLFDYYEHDYKNFEQETSESREYRKQYLRCKEIQLRYLDSSVVRALEIEEGFSSKYMTDQINLMLQTRDSNPTEAIGKGKELVESCCRTILKDKSVAMNKDWSFQQLIGETFKVLNIMPESVDEDSKFAKSLKQMLGNLKAIAGPITEIRNAYGSGHGRDASFKELDPKYAYLMVGVCITLTEFMWNSR